MSGISVMHYYSALVAQWSRHWSIIQMARFNAQPVQKIYTVEIEYSYSVEIQLIIEFLELDGRDFLRNQRLSVGNLSKKESSYYFT